jgi:hypothetical protein
MDSSKDKISGEDVKQGEVVPDKDLNDGDDIGDVHIVPEI